MRRVLARMVRLANTPIFEAEFLAIARDLVTPGRAKERWNAPVRSLWREATRQFDPRTDGELEGIVPAALRPSIRAEALAKLQGEGNASEFNAWRQELGMRPLMLAGSDLRERDLKGYDLRRCVLYGADLRGADLRGCMLQGAVLKDAKIAGAQMGPDTLAGHDLDELADAFEDVGFQTWARNLPTRSLSHLVSVSEVGRKRSGKKTLLWRVKLHNNVSQTLRARVWIENGQHAEMALEKVLEPRRSCEVALKVPRDKFTRDRPLSLAIYIEGITAPVLQFQAWGWDRDWM